MTTDIFKTFDSVVYPNWQRLVWADQQIIHVDAYVRTTLIEPKSQPSTRKYGTKSSQMSLALPGDFRRTFFFSFAWFPTFVGAGACSRRCVRGGFHGECSDEPIQFSLLRFDKLALADVQRASILGELQWKVFYAAMWMMCSYYGQCIAWLVTTSP